MTLVCVATGTPVFNPLISGSNSHSNSNLFFNRMKNKRSASHESHFRHLIFVHIIDKNYEMMFPYYL